MAWLTQSRGALRRFSGSRSGAKTFYTILEALGNTIDKDSEIMPQLKRKESYGYLIVSFLSTALGIVSCGHIVPSPSLPGTLIY
jgi:hypothetical protein